jgi:hypothetical protein
MKIDNVEYEIVFSFPVMYSGWECDEIGHVVKAVGTEELKIALSNHGNFSIVNIDELFEKIDEYRYAIVKTEKAIKMAVKKV